MTENADSTDDMIVKQELEEEFPNDSLKEVSDQKCTVSPSQSLKGEDDIKQEPRTEDASFDVQNSSGEDSSFDRKFRRKSSKPQKVTMPEVVAGDSASGTGGSNDAGLCEVCSSPLVSINNNRAESGSAGAIVLCVECTCEKISILLEENDSCESIRSGSELGYICKRCQPPKSFGSSSDYLEHYVCEHELQRDASGSEEDGATYRCSHCGLQFRSEDDIEQHERYHVESEPNVLRCYFCCREFSDLDTLNKHQNSHATERPHKCPVCHRVFSFTNSLKRHMLIHQTFHNNYACSYCDAKFEDAGQLNRHFDVCDSSVEDSEQFRSTERPSQSSTANDKKFVTHQQTENKADRFLPYSHTCGTCGKSFRLAWRYKLHLKASCDTSDKYNADSDRTCNICKKMFANPMNLHRHELIHAGIRNFSCQLCGKAFVQKTQLDTHMNIHRGIKPFQCDICKKNFTDRSTYHKHKKIHGKPKSFPCTVCGKVFNQAGYLKLHTKVHTSQSIKAEYGVVAPSGLTYCNLDQLKLSM